MTRLKVRVLEKLRRHVERIVVFGGVESLPHGGRVTAILVHLAKDPGHGAMHGLHHGPHALHGRDHLRELGEQLRHDRVYLIEVCYQILQLIVNLVRHRRSNRIGI